VQSVESEPKFWLNKSPPYSGSNKLSKKPVRKQVARNCFHAGTLLSLFDLEDGDDMFLQNAG
jgi:hypothetical protein